MTFTCPSCGRENAFFSLVDENGTHYECPDCNFTWTDDTITTSESDDIDDE